MMMVRCYLGPSSIEGLGVFASQPVKKGAVVWIHDPRFDICYFRDEVDQAPSHFREYLERYTHEHPTDPDRVVLDCDEGRFLNHDPMPNIDRSNPWRGIATRAIAAGDELTCDYSQFSNMLATRFLPSRHRVGQVLHAAE